MICPKCGSERVNVQMVTETNMKVKKHGWVYWCCCLWIVDLLLWFLFTIPMLIIKIFKPKKYKMESKTSKVCICQACGKNWKA